MSHMNLTTILSILSLFLTMLKGCIIIIISQVEEMLTLFTLSLLLKMLKTIFIFKI